MSTDPLSLRGLQLMVIESTLPVLVAGSACDNATLRSLIQAGDADVVLCEIDETEAALQETLFAWLWTTKVRPDIRWAVFLSPNMLMKWQMITEHRPHVLLNKSEQACLTGLQYLLGEGTFCSTELQAVTNNAFTPKDEWRDRDMARGLRGNVSLHWWLARQEKWMSRLINPDEPNPQPDDIKNR
jgi:hypothetical protein